MDKEKELVYMGIIICSFIISISLSSGLGIIIGALTSMFEFGFGIGLILFPTIGIITCSIMVSLLPKRFKVRITADQ